jgi:hypothetical protein
VLLKREEPTLEASPNTTMEDLKKKARFYSTISIFYNSNSLRGIRFILCSYIHSSQKYCFSFALTENSSANQGKSLLRTLVVTIRAFVILIPSHCC